MPLARRNTKLPGTDPTFHEFRLYLAPVKYKGKEILGHFASCKHTKCGFSSAWTNHEARAAGMFKHRSEKVVEARRDHFARTMTDPDRIADMLLDTADRHSHTHDKWFSTVETIWGHYTGLPLNQMPEFKSQVDYHMGVSAREAARKLIAQEYDA